MNTVKFSATLLNIDAAAVVSSVEDLDAVPACAIATHSGSFHCDEALATAMLRVLPQFAEAPIIRTRDAAAIAACTIAVDVGGVYDAATLRFDHHQRTFETRFDGRDVTRLSSAGLVYVHYGREVVATIAAAAGSPLPTDTLEMVYQKIYVDFIEGVDAIDNGVSRAEGPDAYNVRTDLGSRVGCVLESWALFACTCRRTVAACAAALVLTPLLRYYRATAPPLHYSHTCALPPPSPRPQAPQSKLERSKRRLRAQCKLQACDGDGSRRASRVRLRDRAELAPSALDRRGRSGRRAPRGGEARPCPAADP